MKKAKQTIHPSSSCSHSLSEEKFSPTFPENTYIPLEKVMKTKMHNKARVKYTKIFDEGKQETEHCRAQYDYRQAAGAQLQDS